MVEQVIKAARALVERLEEIHADSHYQAVWTLHMIHAGAYVGPTYEFHLDRLKQALERLDTKLPAIGSRWKDPDKRMHGRVVTVIGYDDESGRVIVDSRGKKTKISPDRFGAKATQFQECA